MEEFSKNCQRKGRVIRAPKIYIAKFFCIEVSTIHNICSPKVGREDFMSRLAIFQKIISFGNTRLPLVNIIDRSSYVIIFSFH